MKKSKVLVFSFVFVMIVVAVALSSQGNSIAASKPFILKEVTR